MKRCTTFSLGNIVLAIRISESSTSTPMITLAIAFSHGGLTQGPSTSRSLQSSSRKTVALGSSTPASAWTDGRDQPERRARDQHDAGGRSDHQREARVEELRVAAARG